MLAALARALTLPRHASHPAVLVPPALEAQAHALSPEAIERSLHATRREVVSSSLMLGLTDPFMVPYALALGATTFQAGLLSSVRNFILSLTQLRSADAARWCGSRKRLVLGSAGLQAVLWVPLALVTWLGSGWAVPALIVLYTLGTTSSAFGGPAWGSMLSEYLPPEARGRFFGHRACIAGLCMALAGFAAGAWLQAADAWPALGFGALCLAAAALRFRSVYWLSRFEEGPWHEHPEVRLRFRDFLRQIRHSNFTRFSCCLGAVNVVVNLAAPYLAVYMVRELHFSYLTYTSAILAASLIGTAAVPWWGHIADRFGNQAVLRWTIVGDCVLPLLWAIWPHPALIMLLQALGGFLWAGLNLSAVNFVYDAAAPASRTRYLAYFNVINGCCISAGALAGGWLLGCLPPLRGSAFVTLFCVSALLRLGAAKAFRSYVREVRSVTQIGLREVMYDLVREHVIHVLGFLSVRPEEERPRRRDG